MIRRRTTPSAPAPAPAATPSTPSIRAADLAAAGWLLPKGVDPAAGRAPAWTLVGTVASPTATPVDPAGLVVGEGWSLDWWIGADDRWHLPAREPSVRQDLVADAPVVETRVRIPGGDAVHRAYGIRAARGTGDEWVIAEVENATAVPFAVALVIRPTMADGLGAAGRIELEPVEGGRGRDAAWLVRVDGRPAVVLPRRPARFAAGSHAAGDVVERVTSGAAGEEPEVAVCRDGLATLALVFPLAHTAVLRVALPVGEVDPTEAVPYPAVVPDAAPVAAGWELHRRGPRFELPDRRLGALVERARAQIQLAHDGGAVRRDGRRAPDLDSGATEVLLGAFDLLDRPAEVGLVLTRWIERLADATPEVDALFLEAVSTHWLLHRMDALLDWMLPEVAAAVERLDRAERRGRLAEPTARARAGAGLRGAARVLAAAGQAEAARSVAAVAARVGEGATAPTGVVLGEAEVPAADRLVAVGRAFAAGTPGAADALAAVVATASPTGAWPGPGPASGATRRTVGHDLAAAAALVGAVRRLLVSEGDADLRLVAELPPTWYGGGIEVHDAPTAHGRLSYAVRWHGTRPALLWDLEPHPGAGPVTITAPGLDPAWSTTEVRGDALLGEVAPPAGVEALRVVAEHPDIDPEMRRPGAEPDAPGGPLPEGGTFS
jgi:hypothetical protein